MKRAVKHKLVDAAPESAPAAIPQHVAIIMDGNGRWAKSRGLPRTAGHKRGADSLRNILHACRDAGVKYLTVYAFSSENWKRPPEEVADLMHLLKLYLSKELKELNDSGVRMNFIGDRSRLSDDVREKVEEAEKLTARNTQFTLTVALSYGGRQEMVRAAQRLVEQALNCGLSPARITESQLCSVMDTAGMPDPDLLIRTGGEQRLSNFLLWQSAYAELYFTEVLWPDFGPENFQEALNEFSQRERRYGNAE